MLNFLVGRTIDSFQMVRIVEQSDYFDLTDTVVISYDANKMLQVLIEDPYKKIKTIQNKLDIEIRGEYKPVEVKLIPLHVDGVSKPFIVESVTTYCAIDPLITGKWKDLERNTGNDYILGWNIKGSTEEFFLRVAYEDIVIEKIADSKVFFQHCDLGYKKCFSD